MTSSNGNFFRATGPVICEFPSKRASNADFFGVCPHKLLNKNIPSNERWFETTWRWCDVIDMISNSWTHWGRVTHTCVGNLTIIGSDNGLSPDRRQAIIWTDDGILSIGPLGTNFSEILIRIHTFSSREMHMKMSSAKCRPFCLGLNVLKHHLRVATWWRWRDVVKMNYCSRTTILLRDW